MTALPVTTRLELDPAAQLLPGRNSYSVLIGGSPYVMLTLKPSAAAVIESLRAGADLQTAAASSDVSTPAVQRLARRLLETGLAEPSFEAPSQRGASTSTHRPTDVTAVVPVLNEQRAIGPLVQSLYSAGISHVFVVDDGSTDATARSARDAGATVLTTSGRVGPGGARNAALGHVTTRLALFIDADTLPTGDWLGPLLEAFSDSAVAAAAPRIRSAETGGLIGRYEYARSPLDLGNRRGSVRPRSRIAYVPTAALLVDIEAVRARGGFDAGLRTGEDVDLIWRLAGAGRVVRYEPSAEVFHRPRSTLSKLVTQRRSYGRSAAALDSRHPGQVAPVVASGWSVFVWCSAILGGPLGVVAAAGTALVTAALLERKLDALASPRTPAWTLAMRGHWGVGRQLGSAVWRAWLPVAAVACVFSRRARIAVLAAAVVPNAAEWFERRPPVNPVSFVGMRLIDDTSYCVGVWQGCIRQRSVRALLPRLVNWPGRRNKSRVD